MIQIKTDTAQVKFALVQAAQFTGRPRALLQVVGRAVGNDLRSHFQALQRTPHKHAGERKTNFWRAVRDSVQPPVVTDDSVTVGIAHPAIAQKLYGGVIKAKRTKYLSIPLVTQAYGKSVREFAEDLPPPTQVMGPRAPLKWVKRGKNKGKFAKGSGAYAGPKRRNSALFFLKGKNGNAFLAYMMRGKLIRAYLLRSSVNQRPDEAAQIPMARIDATVGSISNAFLMDHLARYGLE